MTPRWPQDGLPNKTITNTEGKALFFATFEFIAPPAGSGQSSWAPPKKTNGPKEEVEFKTHANSTPGLNWRGYIHPHPHPHLGAALARWRVLPKAAGYICSYIYIYTYTYIHTCIHTYIHTYVCIQYRCLCIYLYIYISIHVYIYMYIAKSELLFI